MAKLENSNDKVPVNGLGSYDKETGVSTLDNNPPNSQYGGIDIYSKSLELSSDCLTNPSKVDLESCEGLYPKNIYKVMDKSKVNEAMQPQAPLSQQNGVSDLSKNPITQSVVNAYPTLSMYSNQTNCKTMTDPDVRINNMPKVKAQKTFGGDLNQVVKKGSGNFLRARNSIGNGIDIYKKSFTNPLEYL